MAGEYKPFDGHQIRLGHYFRHLSQTVSYVRDADGFSDFEKYQYAQTIRAQLSTQEQALLLVNSLTPIGHAWWDDGLMQDYRLERSGASPSATLAFPSKGTEESHVRIFRSADKQRTVK